MAIVWHNIKYSGVNIVSLGIDWQITETDTTLSIQPIIYRWDKVNTSNYGSKWSESLSPDPVGAGSWSGLSWGSGSGTREIDSFSKRTYTKTSSAQTITYKMNWDSSFGSYYNGAFRTLGSGSKTWTITVPPSTSYTLTYNTNGGTGTFSSTTQSKTFKITSTVPVRKGYVFLGWSTNQNATVGEYQIGSSLTLTANTTIYAIWEKVPYKFFVNDNYLTDSSNSLGLWINTSSDIENIHIKI